jgi:hypothetical protein
VLLRNDMYIYIESNACAGIINNYVLSGNIIYLFFVLLCNYSMTELTN